MTDVLTPTGQSRRTIFRLLEKYLVEVTELDEYSDIPTWRYTDGWTDEKIRAEVQSQYPLLRITSNIITGRRNRSWGPLFKVQKKKTVEEELAELRATLASSSAQLAEIKLLMAEHTEFLAEGTTASEQLTLIPNTWPSEGHPNAKQ
tara:strand:- start:770 stop:1210 length:441 start_codon:yes stop_codon:yes gene_type:complete